MVEISIGNRKIGNGNPSFIVAEVGVNHNGDVKMAMDMIDAIAEAGADSVKFQTFKAEEFVSNSTDYYEYKSQGSIVRESQLEMFRRLELRYSEFGRLFERARKNGIIPLSTPVDTVGADLLDDLGVEAFKIGSDDLVYTQFLEYISEKKKPVIISGGMGDAEDLDRAVSVIKSKGTNGICILHCRSIYPTPDKELNLRQILSLKDKYDLPVGFSDHSEGILAALGAVALGAVMIEKHFTLDKSLPGPDHHFSMDPYELRELVNQTRRLESSLGDGDIGPSPEELEMRILARRSIVAARDLATGHVLSINDLAFKRPGSGLMPYHANELIGRKLNSPIPKNSQITFKHLRSKKDSVGIS